MSSRTARFDGLIGLMGATAQPASAVHASSADRHCWIRHCYTNASKYRVVSLPIFYNNIEHWNRACSCMIDHRPINQRA